MFGQIDTIRMARDLTAHAAARQQTVARNVANADTPGYRAQDLRDFADVWHDRPPVEMRTTHARHVGPGAWGSRAHAPVDAGGETAPNGNTVSLEDEMVRAAAAKRSFDLSLTVWQSGMSLMRTALGRRG
ncbi:MAG TPA: FlgB family protein [Paracoccus sp. (in: a-proteobacteria)]|nr:FlgB family protein [Paracoccus sp. (in: a-proteobacteria)]